jgi:hypothetical protein
MLHFDLPGGSMKRVNPVSPISLTNLALAISLIFAAGACASDSEEDDTSSGTSAGDGDGDGDGSGDGDGDGDGDGTGDGDGDGDGDGTGDGDGDGDGDGFFGGSACPRMLECFAEVLPGQYDAAYEQYGPDSDCWADYDAAIVCHEFCEIQADNAAYANPGIGECHGHYCPLEELTPDLPYSPISDGCDGDEIELSPQGFQGSFCSPPCGGLAEVCPGHQDTIATGSCLFGDDNQGYCALLCTYEVDPLWGIQCPCGAVCESLGQEDGNGNTMGICTYVD